MMDNEMLESILANNCALPDGASLEGLTVELEENLGSVDESLRENSLSILWEWVEQGFYTTGMLSALGNRMVGQMQTGLGESEGDAVFCRAFSALILAAVISADARQARSETGGFLGDETVSAWLDESLRFYDKEKDGRGYVQGKGWAHALAHGADLLLCLGMHPSVKDKRQERILDGLGQKAASMAGSIFLFNEDERMARAAMGTLLREDISLSAFEHWITSILQRVNATPRAEAHQTPEAHHARYNARLFLRSLYFQLIFGARIYRDGTEHKLHPEARDAFLEALEIALKDLDEGVFYQTAGKEPQ